MAQLALWNGDICDLEVDAIVNPANVTLWMSTGVAGAIKRRGGEAIEFAAVRQAPVEMGGAIVTDAGSLGARWVIHAVSLDHQRRTSAVAIERAVRSALARARELGVETLAIPALGTGVGGFPLDEAARITVAAVRAEAPRLPRLRTITFALRGAAAYEAFRLALAAPEAAAAPAGGSRA
jgi:O-acetyl-ADP-ribose deacetylase (regulator of RNase III)